MRTKLDQQDFQFYAEKTNSRKPWSTRRTQVAVPGLRLLEALTPAKQTAKANKMLPLVSEGRAQTPTVRYQGQCVQNLADKLTAFEERMSESNFGESTLREFRRNPPRLLLKCQKA